MDNIKIKILGDLCTPFNVLSSHIIALGLFIKIMVIIIIGVVIKFCTQSQIVYAS